ncbi:MAG TPA: hypothetical protein VGK71_03345, partial [Nitrospirota bacterium]
SGTGTMSEGLLASWPRMKAVGRYGILTALFALYIGATGIIDLNKYYHSYYYISEASLMKERYLDTPAG